MIRKKQKITAEAEGTAIIMVWEGEVYIRKWIRWTPEREKELMRLYTLAKPAKVGYISRLQCLWNREFPDLTTISTALTRQLYVIRNRENEPVAQAALVQTW